MRDDTRGPQERAKGQGGNEYAERKSSEAGEFWSIYKTDLHPWASPTYGRGNLSCRHRDLSICITYT